MAYSKKIKSTAVEEEVIEASEPIVEEIKVEEPKAPEAKIMKVECKSVLNIRELPSANGKIIGTLANGTPVRVAEVVGDFTKLAGRDGYVMSKFLK